MTLQLELFRDADRWQRKWVNRKPKEDWGEVSDAISAVPMFKDVRRLDSSELLTPTDALLIAELAVELGPGYYDVYASRTDNYVTAFTLNPTEQEFRFRTAARPHIFSPWQSPIVGEEPDDAPPTPKPKFAKVTPTRKASDIAALLPAIVRHAQARTLMDMLVMVHAFGETGKLTGASHCRAVHIAVRAHVEQRQTRQHGYLVTYAPIPLDRKDPKKIDVVTVDPLPIIRIPNWTPDGERTKDTRLLVSSPRFFKALDELCRALRHTEPKSVLLLCPPGSGKEELSKFFTGALRKHVLTRSIGGAGAPEIQKVADDAARLLNTHGRLTIHLDEVDKCEENARNALLRLMESDDIERLARERRHSRQKFGEITWLFTGSRPWSVVRNQTPIDLWTRIVRRIDGQHPLLPDPFSWWQDWAADYLQLFWGLACDNARQTMYSDTEEPNPIRDLAMQAGPVVARQFGSVLEDVHACDISIRNIRNAADIMWTRWREAILRGDVPWPAPGANPEATMAKWNTYEQLVQVVSGVHY